MTKKDFQRFGKYLILDHLVDGGMAKICRARFLGEQADKLVAIKMVQQRFSKDPSFMKMFEDELKVTFALMHPNIAQTYDYGMVDDQLYTAMEYVDGANLKQFLDRLKKKNFVFPVEISTYIISQVCQALHYAHTFKDKMSGKSLNIIHRDISPHNIMLTYDGAVKVIDFGIAKADSNSESTQAGTIKGKLSYLAPEYLDGMTLDSRYDEFAVGVTLWELLCSRRLFTAPNDLAVLKQIQACKVPAPSSINPNVPKELDEIVLKALSKDREDRYEDMDKFNRALVKFLYSHFPDFNSSDLGYFAKQLFKTEIESDQRKFVEYGKIDIRPFIKDFENNANNKDSLPKNITEKHDLDAEDKKQTVSIKFKDEELDSKTLLGIAGGGVLPTDDTMRSFSQVKPDVPEHKKIKTRRSTESRKNGVKTKTLKKKDFNPEGHAKKSTLPYLFIAGICALAFLKPALVEEQFGFNPKELIFGKSQPTHTEEVKHKKVVDNDVFNPDNAVISFVGYDTMMKILINGKEVSLQGIDAKVPTDQPLEVTIVKNGHRPFKKQLKIVSESEVYNFYIPELQKEKIGLLTTSLNYPTGTHIVFEIGGQRVTKELPLRNERIPAGLYEAKVINPLLGTEKKVKIKIEENKKHFLD